MTKIKDFLSVSKNRTYLYNVVRALIPVLIASGFLIPGLDEVIMTLVAAVLGLGANELAKHNVTPEEVDEEGLGL